MSEEAQLTLSSEHTTNRRGTRLREVAYRAIKDAILAGKVHAHQALVEERLAAQLQISRTPVREALAILEHEGLIEAVPYQGLFVKDIAMSEFQELYESAGTIEPELARLATTRIATGAVAASAVNAMEEILVQAEQYATSDIPRLLAACRLFQQKMGECAGNSYLTALLISIEERTDLYLISKGKALQPDKMLAAVTDRRAILAALRSGNAQEAVLASREHVKALRERWQEFFHRDYVSR